MVRGWLSQELQGAKSIRDARGKDCPAEIIQRIALLEKGIRAIDLE